MKYWLPKPMDIGIQSVLGILLGIANTGDDLLPHAVVAVRQRIRHCAPYGVAMV